MRRKLIWALILCLAVITAAALASVTTAQEPPTPGHVAGHVRAGGEGGTLLDGVLAEALSGTTVVASTTSHSGGSYELALAAGTYTLRYSLTGYSTLTRAGINVAAGQTTTLDVGLSPPPPVFHVALSVSGIGGEGWPAGVMLTVTADDPDTATKTDFVRYLATDVNGVFAESQLFPGVEPGWVFTVTGGVPALTKEHTVRDISITSVDPATDTVRGKAEPGSTVRCNPMAAQGIYDQQKEVQTSTSGDWAASFSAPLNITPGSVVEATQVDEDYDFTSVVWRVPRPVGWQHDSVSHHDYFFAEERLSWTAAEARAVRLGGHLVTINGVGEQQWLVAKFGTEYWIGLKRTAVGSPWVWASSEPVTFTGWLSGEPTDYPSENFAVISNRPPNIPTIGWNDVPADVSMPFVVEAGPTTVGGLLAVMVGDGALPNAGVATSIRMQAQKVSLKALTNHLTDLVRRSVITQQTMDQILAMVAG